jgi:hypothetical protein
VIITKSPPGQTSDPVSKPTDPAGATFYGQPTGRTGPDGKPELGTGKGSPTEIQYNPERLDRADSADKLGKAIDDRADDARGRNPANSFGDGRAPDPPPGGGAPSGSGGAPSFPEKETP